MRLEATKGYIVEFLLLKRDSIISGATIVPSRDAHAGLLFSSATSAYLRQLPYASDNFGTVSAGLGLTLSRVLARIGKS